MRDKHISEKVHKIKYVEICQFVKCCTQISKMRTLCLNLTTRLCIKHFINYYIKWIENVMTNHRNKHYTVSLAFDPSTPTLKIMRVHGKRTTWFTLVGSFDISIQLFVPRNLLEAICLCLANKDSFCNRDNMTEKSLNVNMKSITTRKKDISVRFSSSESAFYFWKLVMIKV